MESHLIGEQILCRCLILPKWTNPQQCKWSPFVTPGMRIRYPCRSSNFPDENDNSNWKRTRYGAAREREWKNRLRKNGFQTKIAHMLAQARTHKHRHTRFGQCFRYVFLSTKKWALALHHLTKWATRFSCLIYHSNYTNVSILVKMMTRTVSMGKHGSPNAIRCVSAPVIARRCIKKFNRFDRLYQIWNSYWRLGISKHFL